MIVIGVDTHKRSRTLVALDAATGATRGVLTIAASDDGTLDAVRFAGKLDGETGGRSRTVGTCRVVWSEDCSPPATGSCESRPD
jgi:hypothetical protein